MKARVLESELQRLRGFGAERRVQLEQYETPPHIAARALLAAAAAAHLPGAAVLDACCGPGVLGAGAALLGAQYVLCADIDPAALACLLENRAALAERHAAAAAALHPLLVDLAGPAAHRLEHFFDVVVMNPPFGTKHNAGLDMRLLQNALALCRGHVFSFHKTSTRDHVGRRTRAWGVAGEVVAELRYDLPASYGFHRQRSRDVAVDLWHLDTTH